MVKNRRYSSEKKNHPMFTASVFNLPFAKHGINFVSNFHGLPVLRSRMMFRCEIFSTWRAKGLHESQIYPRDVWLTC